MEAELANLSSDPERLPAFAIAHADSGLVRLNLVATNTRKASLRIIVGDGFPENPKAVTIDCFSTTLSTSVTERIAKLCTAAAEATTPGSRVFEAAATGWGIIQANKLLWAHDELKRLKKRLKSHPCVSGVRVNERAGTIAIDCEVPGGIKGAEWFDAVRISTETDKPKPPCLYKACLLIRVPNGYPDEPLVASVVKISPRGADAAVATAAAAMTWPRRVLRPFLAQATVIAEKAASGIRSSVILGALGPAQTATSGTGAAAAAAASGDKPGAAVAGSARATLTSLSLSHGASKPAAVSSASASGGLTSSQARSLKEDVRFFKQVSQTRAVVVERKASNAKEHTHSSAERRRATSYLRLMAKKESAKEGEEAARADAELRAEAELLMGDAAPLDQGQPCLEVLWEALGERCLASLPAQRCPLSGAALFPAVPAELDDLLEATSADKSAGASRKRRPLRAGCGHWFNWAAVNRAMSKPPFHVECPVCGERVTHPDWPLDTSVLERAWARKQAKKRELDDVLDFLGEAIDGETARVVMPTEGYGDI